MQNLFDWKHIAVPITYNGRSQFNPAIDDNVDNHGLGLAVRALYRYTNTKIHENTVLIFLLVIFVAEATWNLACLSKHCKMCFLS